jgi:secondary thiamine-phosphate synthase enzyme
MDTLTQVCPRRQSTFRLATSRRTEFVDLTDRLVCFLANTQIHDGLVNVQTLHTTTGIVVNEHEPLLLEDFEAFLERAVPRQATYRHDDLSRRGGVPAGEPVNGHAHCRALLLPTSTCLNVIGGRLRLGRWQRVFLVELDGPREREVSVVVLEGGR